MVNTPRCADKRVACCDAPSEPKGQTAAAAKNASLSSADLLFLSFVVLLGALLRLDFMRASHYVIDADEAIVGLMAKHITEGASIPVFYYGQHYMGSLEALLAAASFAIFGVSSWALQLVPLVCSLLLVVVMYFLGREFGGRYVGRVASLLTAIPPVALVVWSVKARGGFIEILLLGALALVVAARWWKGRADDTRLPIVLGLILGLGFWTNNQIIYFIGPIALFSLVFVVRALLSRRCSVLSTLRVVFFGTLAFLLGSAPFWIYNIEKGFPSLGMFGLASGEEILKHSEGLFSASLPILLGAKHFWELEPAYPGSTFIAYTVYGFLVTALLWLRRRDILALFRGHPNLSAPVEVLVLFVVFSCTVFVVSTFGWLVQAPRYLLPLYVGIFILCGYVAWRASECSRALSALVVSALLCLNLLSAYAGGRAVPGEPVVFQGQRVSRDHSQLISTLEQLGIRHIRTNYWIGYRVAFETHERITFSLFGAPYQLRLPQYEAGISRDESNRTPILTVPAEAAVVRDVLGSLGTSFEELAVGGYVLFYSIAERYPAKLVALSPTVVRAHGWGTRDFSAAVDGSADSRWGTGAHQQPGQAFTIEFATPRVVSGLMYELGVWLHDYPRGMEISVETASGAARKVLTEEQYEKAQIYLRENRGLSLLWPPEPVKSITLTQTKSDPVFDWTIAELYIYEPLS